MVEQDKYCIDVLTQVSATTRALQSVALQLLDDHLSHCVTEAAAQGGERAAEKVAEASAAIARLRDHMADPAAVSDRSARRGPIPRRPR